MIKPLHHHLLLALLLTGGGLMLGRTFFSHRYSVPLPAADMKADQQIARPRPHPGTPGHGPGNTAHDFQSLLALYRQRQAQGDPVQRRELGRLGIHALRALILRDPGETAAVPGTPESIARAAVSRAALAELYRREGIAALGWAAALDADNGRQAVTHELLLLALRDQPEAAKPWLDRFQHEYGQHPSGSPHVREAMIAAKSRGADELIRVHALFGPASGSGILGPAPFPEDFDFARLHTALTGKIDLQEAVRHWAFRDKNAAWQAVKADIATRGADASPTFGALVHGAVASHGEAGGLKWTVARLDELPPDQRTLCIQQLDNSGKLSARGLTALVGQLSAADREDLAPQVLRTFRSAEKAFIILASLPHETLVATLEASARDHRAHLDPSRTDDPAAHLQHLFTEAETRFALTEAEKSRLAAAKQE